MHVLSAYTFLVQKQRFVYTTDHNDYMTTASLCRKNAIETINNPKDMLKTIKNCNNTNNGNKKRYDNGQKATYSTIKAAKKILIKIK